MDEKRIFDSLGTKNELHVNFKDGNNIFAKKEPYPTLQLSSNCNKKFVNHPWPWLIWYKGRSMLHKH